MGWEEAEEEEKAEEAEEAEEEEEEEEEEEVHIIVEGDLFSPLTHSYLLIPPSPPPHTHILPFLLSFIVFTQGRLHRCGRPDAECVAACLQARGGDAGAEGIGEGAGRGEMVCLVRYTSGDQYNRSMGVALESRGLENHACCCL